MSKNDLVSPKTFISYSWTTPEHEEWVLDLATRLTSDGVEVILDKWDLREGNDVHRFMESMVHQDDSIDKVLIICDKGYKEKADNRQGGVGVESQIITPQIYNDVQQEKFIPIVAQRDSEGNDFIPIYIASRLYIDLSSSDDFEENYEVLLRSIYNKPMYRKPTIGKPPAFLLEEELPRYLTTPIVNKMKVASEKYPHKMLFFWGEFQEKLFETLDNLQLNIDNPNEIEVIIKEKIQQLIPVRNDFIDAIELLVMTDTIHSDDFIEFYEQIFIYTEFQNTGSFYESQFDHFKFFIMESFLYTITILLKAKKYNIISEILNFEYHFNSRTSRRNSFFSRLRFYLSSLDKLNTETRRLSVHADLINQFKHKKYGKEIAQTDLILYFISKINPIFDNWSTWFPVTYIYLEEDEPIRFLSRLSSQNHFEKTKSIFGVTNKESLAERINNFEIDRGYSGSWHHIPHPSSKISIENLCVQP